MEHVPTKLILELDEELRTYMPQVNAETDAELERQILETGGPVDDLTVWQERNIILDGYRRFKICTKHNLPFKIRHVSLPDLDAAKEWMTNWALARRNITKNQRAVLLRDLVLINMRRGMTKSAAEKKVGALANLARKGVDYNFNYAEQLDKLPKPIKKKIVSSRLETPVQTIHRLASLEPEKQAELVESIDLAKRGELSKAVAAAKSDWTEVDAQAPVAHPKIGAGRVLGETRKAFGIFLKHLHNLSRSNPNPTAMARAKQSCDQLSNILEAWSAE